MHSKLLPYLIPNYVEQDGYDSSLWTTQFTRNSPIQLLLFYKVLQKRLQHRQNYFYLLCNSKEESRTVNYCTKHIKGRRGLKGPPTTARAGQLTQFRESRPTPPTTAAFPLFPPRTKCHIAHEEAACCN